MALQMHLYLQMTRDVEKKTGQVISSKIAMEHKNIKEELLAQ